MLTATEFASRAEPLLGATRKPELGEVVVFTDNRSDAARILEFVGLLAEGMVRLINVFTQPAPAITLPQEFARSAGIQEVIETHQSQLESIEGRHPARFGDVVRRHRIPQAEWRSFSSGVRARYE